MSLGDFQVFNEFAYNSATEVIDQQVNLFNEATRGAIVLAQKGNVGDFFESAQYSLISGLVKNRNAYSTAAATAVDLAQLKEVAVKVGMQTDPVRFTGTSFDWIQRPAEEAGVVFGTQWAQGQLQYMLNTALASANAALAGVGADVTYDGTAGAASLESLNLGAGKFGDRRSQLASWVMHSKSQTDIYGQSLANANRLFEFGTVQVMSDGHGRPLIVTDSDALVFDNAGTDNYIQLGLVPGAIMLDDNGDTRIYEQTDILKQNVEQLIKAESSFNIGLKGYTWDMANGGKSPDDAALALSTNWDKTATSIKDTLGVRAITL